MQSSYELPTHAEAWADAHAPGPAQGRSRYKPMCACCAPEALPLQAGRPQRRTSTRPVLAWRARLAALQAQDTALAEAERIRSQTSLSSRG